MTGKKSSKREYSQFREYLEVLSEKSRILRNRFYRNHFYNHAFNNGTLVKVANIRRIVDEMYQLAEHSHAG